MFVRPNQFKHIISLHDDEDEDDDDDHVEHNHHDFAAWSVLAVLNVSQVLVSDLLDRHLLVLLIKLTSSC